MSPRTGRTGHIAWRQHGSDPRILALHGFTDSGACWDPVIAALGRAVVALDARGHGESGLPEEPYGAPEQAADAAAVLDDLGMRDVIVMGHSMGGANAVALAEARPDVVRALVLEDPYIRTGPSRRSREVPESFRALQAMTLEQRIEKGRAENPTWPEGELEPWARSKGQFNLNVHRLRRSDATPTVQTLRELTIPVLLLHGDADRGSIVNEQVLATAGEHVHPVHIAGCGHSIRREQQAAFLDAVRGFLAEHLD